MNKDLLGYNGKIAYIDLNNQKVNVKELDPQIAKIKGFFSERGSFFNTS